MISHKCPVLNDKKGENNYLFEIHFIGAIIAYPHFGHFYKQLLAFCAIFGGFPSSSPPCFQLEGERDESSLCVK